MTRPAYARSVALLLLSWALLTAGLTSRSLWFDEYLTLQMSQGTPAHIIDTAAADIHPPLYFLTQSAWLALAGTSDFALRWLSPAAGLLAVALMLKLARQLLGRPAALPAALLLALAPAFVEFSRMARYYALVVALALLTSVLLVRAARRGGWPGWLAYALSGLALVSTFYPAAVLFAVHGLWLLWPGLLRPAARAGRAWLVATAGVGLAGLLLYGPVLLARATAISQAGGADLARSGLGLALGLGMTGYTFSVGETIFPWNPVAWLGLAALAALVVAAAWRRLRLIGPLLGGLVLCAVGVALVTTFISVNTPFLNVPVRALFAWPLLGLTLAAGLRRLPIRWARLAGGALLVAWAVGLGNYYLGQQFLNPIYLTPAREAATLIATTAGPQDAVLVETDSLVGYYLARQPAAPPVTDAMDAAAVEQTLAAAPPTVWLVTLGRDQTADLSTATTLRAALAADYAPATTERLLPLDPTYVHYKELLLRRPSYTNRLTIETFTRRTAP